MKTVFLRGWPGTPEVRSALTVLFGFTLIVTGAGAGAGGPQGVVGVEGVRSVEIADGAAFVQELTEIVEDECDIGVVEVASTPSWEHQYKMMLIRHRPEAAAEALGLHADAARVTSPVDDSAAVP